MPQPCAEARAQRLPVRAPSPPPQRHCLKGCRPRIHWLSALSTADRTTPERNLAQPLHRSWYVQFQGPLVQAGREAPSLYAPPAARSRVEPSSATEQRQTLSGAQVQAGRGFPFLTTARRRRPRHGNGQDPFGDLGTGRPGNPPSYSRSQPPPQARQRANPFGDLGTGRPGNPLSCSAPATHRGEQPSGLRVQAGPEPFSFSYPSCRSMDRRHWPFTQAPCHSPFNGRVATKCSTAPAGVF